MWINEFLPNPVGKDPAGEFIELFNEGREPQNLSGWKLKDASGKTFILKGTLGVNEYLVLDNKTTKLSLNNDSETLYLFDVSGKQIDSLGFTVTAPSGKSFIRQADSRGVFTDKPTPGAPNVFENQNAVENTPYDANANLALAVGASPNAKSGATAIQTSSDVTGIVLGIAIALVLAAFFLFVYKKLDLEKESEYGA